MSKVKKAKFALDYTDNPKVATFKKLIELEDKFNLEKGEKGDKGDKPMAGVDYKIPQDGKDGKDGNDGYTPIKGKDYFDGEDGQDGKDGSPDTPNQIADKLNTLKEKVEIKVIKNLEKRLNEKQKETIKEIPKSKVVERYIQRVAGGGGASYHTNLNDMPDTDGDNTDHDTRLVAKVQDDEPTANPVPYEGQFWYDTDEDGGALPYTVNVKTKLINHTADDTDYVLLMDTTGGNLTLTLPTAVGIAGRVYVIMNIGSGGNTLTIDPDGTETINRNLTQDILDLDSVRVISDGSNWWII
jgi:hypothetical protein